VVTVIESRIRVAPGTDLIGAPIDLRKHHGSFAGCSPFFFCSSQMSPRSGAVTAHRITFSWLALAHTMAGTGSGLGDRVPDELRIDFGRARPTLAELRICYVSISFTVEKYRGDLSLTERLPDRGKVFSRFAPSNIVLSVEHWLLVFC
jgi:hypothetical protein